MRTILSIILILSAVGGTIAYIVPTYREAQAIGIEKAEYSELLANARQLSERRDTLLGIYNTMDRQDLERLEKMLPANPDNVKLILEIDALANRFGLTLQNVSIQESQEESRNTRTQVRTNEDIGTLGIQFTTTGSYTGYVQFVNAIEQNLRIMNIQKVSFVAPEDRSNYQYQTTVETYWIR